MGTEPKKATAREMSEMLAQGKPWWFGRTDYPIFSVTLSKNQVASFIARTEHKIDYLEREINFGGHTEFTIEILRDARAENFRTLNYLKSIGQDRPTLLERVFGKKKEPVKSNPFETKAGA